MTLAARSLPGRLEPSTVYWGKFECWSVDAVADSSDSLNDTYWEFSVPKSEFDSAKTAEDFYVWYDTGAGTDPALPGKTGIAVSISTDDTAEAVAIATESAIDAVTPSRVTVEREGAKLVIENREFGATTAASDSGSTGFTFTQLTEGTGGNLGATNGGITLNTETESVDITSDQTGSYVLDQVNVGASVNMEMSLQEMDAEKWALVVGGVVGDNFTPSGGTEVTGFGENKLYKNLLPLSGQLVLKPLSTAAGDNSRNITFWRSAPLPSSINFDNEIQALAVNFAAYLDPSKPTEINLFIFGDQDQDGFY